jgi:hypothetical protein
VIHFGSSPSACEVNHPPPDFLKALTALGQSMFCKH